MIRSFTVTNPSLPSNDNSLEVELENPYASGFFVAGITGLGPPKADINTTRRAGSDGSVYNSSKVESRNIVITLLYMGSNVEALRHKVYRYFPIKRPVTLYFKTDTRTASISGYVESNEVNLFTNMEGSQISIICNDPWFISNDAGTVSMNLVNINALFEFPVGFIQEENEGKIEFSKKQSGSIGSITYNGDLETGMTITLKCRSTMGDIKFINTDRNEMFTISNSLVRAINNNSGLASGDEIVITTHTGRKTVRLYRGSSSINIIAAVEKTSVWPKIYSGENHFSTAGTSGTVDVSISVTTLYEGI